MVLQGQGAGRTTSWDGPYGDFYEVLTRSPEHLSVAQVLVPL